MLFLTFSKSIVEPKIDSSFLLSIFTLVDLPLWTLALGAFTINKTMDKDRNPKVITEDITTINKNDNPI